MDEKDSVKAEEIPDGVLLDGNNILDAVARKDWSCLRTLSLKAGGFGEERSFVWPFLLHAERCGQGSRDSDLDDKDYVLRQRRRKASDRGMKREDIEEEKSNVVSRSSSAERHPDERQIKLDTDRSFVLYPGQRDRDELQAELNELITTVFRRHTRLSYFQGYHDIVTVLFLTLPEDEQLPCVEKLSLHRLRDAMGKGLEPLLGLLHILKYLLRLADPKFATLLERNTPLPYFALSNLLTSFSHDVPTLPLIQHVFDYLLCRPPIAAVYLVAAITLARKDEAERMEEEGEEVMLHSILSSLPELYDGDDVSIPDEKCKPESLDDASIILEENSQRIPPGKNKASLECELAGDPGDENLDKSFSESRAVQKLVEAHTDDHEDVTTNSTQRSSDKVGNGEVLCEIKSNAEPSLQREETLSSTCRDQSEDSNLPPEIRRIPSGTPPPSRPSSSLSHTSSHHGRRPRVSLTVLLEHADTLIAQFPPTISSLHVSDIMGPQSVIFTWAEDPHDMASDAEAEAMVMHPELVALPFVDPDELMDRKEDSGSESSAAHGKGRRKLRKQRHPKHFGVRMDKKTVLTGAVVALGVAAAVYSMRAKGGHGGALDAVRSEKAWRKAGKLISGVMIGGSERLLDTFGW